MTYTFTTDAVGNPEPIIAQSNCVRITIFEDNLAATQDYIVHRPNADSAGVKKPAGTSFEFLAGLNGHFRTGQTIGYVETAAGSITMAQVED